MVRYIVTRSEKGIPRWLNHMVKRIDVNKTAAKIYGMNGDGNAGKVLAYNPS